MITISLCMIVKNEEDVLGRCLESAAGIADEIIIVDTGSDDKTEQIALQHGAVLHHFPWVQDFAAARNFAFSKATSDYILWLDADDIFKEKDRLQFLKLKEDLPPITDMVVMRYDVSFDAQDNPTFSYHRERLMKRSMNYQWVGAVHEVISYRGNILYSEIAVSHKKLHPTEAGRNLAILEKVKAEQGLDIRQQYYYARELYYNGFYPQAAAELAQFIQNEEAWLENRINACLDLAHCFQRMNEPKKALSSLVESFTLDLPRAEAVCEIARYFFDLKQFKTAAYWYEMAYHCPIPLDKGGFVSTDCYGYIPAIQLSVCFDRLGDIEKAVEWNEKAGQKKPLDASYLYNKTYFDSIKKQE